MRVARQVLSPMPELLSYWLPLEDAKVLIRYLNEQIAEMIALAPDRFTGLGAVPLQDMDSAIVELDFLIKKLKFSGVEIASHVNGVSIGDARFEPFFAAAGAGWRGDLRPRAASGGPGPHRRRVRRAGGVFPGGYRARSGLDDHRRHRRAPPEAAHRLQPRRRRAGRAAAAPGACMEGDAQGEGGAQRIARAPRGASSTTRWYSNAGGAVRHRHLRRSQICVGSDYPTRWRMRTQSARWKRRGWTRRAGGHPLGQRAPLPL